MDYLNLGTIIKTHGICGELVIKSNTYFANERYKKGNKIILINPNSKEELMLTVSDYHSYKGNDYVTFEEINTFENAKELIGYTVNILKSEADLPENYYLFSDLIDCLIIDQNDNIVGKVVKVEEFPAQITLRCKTKDDKNFFVPFIDKIFINSVSIEKKEIHINFMKGML